MENEEPQDTFCIQTPQHWKAISHPLRLGIVRLLRQKAMTNEELAHALGVASGKLYFHTRQLLDAGLIRLVGTRQKQAITEKLYRATAHRFRAAPPLDGEDASTPSGEVESAIQLYQNTLRESPDLFAPDRSLADHSLLFLSPRKAGEVFRKLRALIEDAVASRTSEADAIPMALTILLYPLPGPVQATDDPEEGNGP